MVNLQTQLAHAKLMEGGPRRLLDYFDGESSAFNKREVLEAFVRGGAVNKHGVGILECPVLCWGFIF